MKRSTKNIHVAVPGRQNGLGYRKYLIKYMKIRGGGGGDGKNL